MAKSTEKPATEKGAKLDAERKVLTLSKPLVIGERTITELSLDCSSLTTADFISLADECRLRYRLNDADNIMQELKFRLTVLARLNKLPVEDLEFLTFGDGGLATKAVGYFFFD